MKCPKCGYISFDFNEKCPNCSRDLKEIREKLILFPFKPSAVDWLSQEEPEVQEAQQPSEKEEIELEQISLDSFTEEQQEAKEEIKEDEGEIELEPVELKSLEEQIQKKKQELIQEIQEKKEEEEEKGEIELEPIELENLEIELEEDEEKK